jgi:hypothetical protein
MKVEIHGGEIIPKGYGIAYPCPFKDTFICYPMPLNWVVRIWSAFYQIMRHCFFTKAEKDLQKMYRKGLNEGYEKGFKHLVKRLNDMEDLIKGRKTYLDD